MNTAVVSDLHLCEAEPVSKKLPLWKKYKTKEFFFDTEFQEFLTWIEAQSHGSPVELVLNGDIFDFDSVLSLPDEPIYQVSYLEKLRGLRPEPLKSRFKIEKILEDHPIWVKAVSSFLSRGHQVIFVTGNHDVEVLFPEVQRTIRKNLDPHDQYEKQIRFADWFYISEKDTLIEHGHQYDPYCVLEDPIEPFIKVFNRYELRVPFGNLATRNILNGMGYFNPHAESNYIMTIPEYVRFFFKYMIRSQPLIIWTWFWGASVTLYQAVQLNFSVSGQDPLTREDRIEEIAERSNATPRMVREMRALVVPSAARNVVQIARELWLDRALILLGVFYLVGMLFLLVQQVVDISVFWFLVPLLFLLPFFLFYSGSVESRVAEFKEPRDRTLALASMITKTNRVIYGHTHIPRHELFGPVEHLNSGTWSPAFEDVECQRPIGAKTFIWISQRNAGRVARLMKFQAGSAKFYNA